MPTLKKRNETQRKPRTITAALNNGIQLIRGAGEGHESMTITTIKIINDPGNYQTESRSEILASYNFVANRANM